MKLTFNPALQTVTWECHCGFSLTGTSLVALDGHILRHRTDCLRLGCRNPDDWQLSDYDKMFLQINNIAP